MGKQKSERETDASRGGAGSNDVGNPPREAIYAGPQNGPRMYNEDADIFMNTPASRNYNHHNHHHYNNPSHHQHAPGQSDFPGGGSPFKWMKLQTQTSSTKWKQLIAAEKQLTKSFLKQNEGSKDVIAGMARVHREAVEESKSNGEAIDEDHLIREDIGMHGGFNGERKGCTIVRDPSKVKNDMIITIHLDPVDEDEGSEDEDTEMYKAIALREDIFDCILPGSEHDTDDLMPIINTVMDQILDNAPQLIDNTIPDQEWGLIVYIMEMVLDENTVVPSSMAHPSGNGTNMIKYNTENEDFTAISIQYIAPSSPVEMETQQEMNVRDRCINALKPVKVKADFKYFASEDQLKAKDFEFQFSTSLDFMHLDLPYPLALEDSLTTCRIFADYPPASPVDEAQLGLEEHRQRVAVRCKNKNFEDILREDILQRIFALQLGSAKLFWRQREHMSEAAPLPLITLVPKSSRFWYADDGDYAHYCTVKTVATAKGKCMRDNSKEKGKDVIKKILIETTYILEGRYYDLDLPHAPEHVVYGNNPFADGEGNGQHMFAPFGVQNSNPMMARFPMLHPIQPAGMPMPNCGTGMMMMPMQPTATGACAAMMRPILQPVTTGVPFTNHIMNGMSLKEAHRHLATAMKKTNGSAHKMLAKYKRMRTSMHSFIQNKLGFTHMRSILHNKMGSIAESHRRYLLLSSKNKGREDRQDAEHQRSGVSKRIKAAASAAISAVTKPFSKKMNHKAHSMDDAASVANYNGVTRLLDRLKVEPNYKFSPLPDSAFKKSAPTNDASKSTPLLKHLRKNSTLVSSAKDASLASHTPLGKSALKKNSRQQNPGGAVETISKPRRGIRFAREPLVRVFPTASHFVWQPFLTHAESQKLVLGAAIAAQQNKRKRLFS